MKSARIRAAFASLLMALAASCGTQGAPARESAGIGAEREIQVTEYRLGVGDEIQISVFGRPELTGPFPVQAQGAVSYPLLGEVPASGRTVAELQADITNRLRPDYVRDPQVNISVIRYRPFFILGEVGDPGTYPYTPGLTVMNAVATAGGFSYRANSQRVFIQHANEQGETEYALTSTTPVQPGDTVRIPERRF